MICGEIKIVTAERLSVSQAHECIKDYGHKGKHRCSCGYGWD